MKKARRVIEMYTDSTISHVVNTNALALAELTKRFEKVKRTAVLSTIHTGLLILIIQHQITKLEERVRKLEQKDRVSVMWTDREEQ